MTQTRQRGAAAPPRIAPWRDPGLRALVLQVLVLAAAVALAAILVGNTLENLERRGIASGFGFLGTEAGFGINQSLIEYDESASYGRAFVVGLLNTLLVSVLGIVLATVLGFVMGVARLSHNWLIARLASLYIELFRNVPLLLQLFFWYFAVLRALPSPRASLELGAGVSLNIRGLYLPAPVPEPGAWAPAVALAAALGVVLALRLRARRRHAASGRRPPVLAPALLALVGLPLAALLLAGVPVHWELPRLQGFNFQGGLVLTPELMALVLALTIYTGTFIAEIVRAGILSVSHGQSEAAYALGLGHGLTLRLVVIPQAMRVIVPPLTSQYLNLTKNSSLAAAIAYPDLVSVFAGTVLNQTGQAVEVIAITMAVYLSISLLIALGMGWYNRRVALQDH